MKVFISWSGDMSKELAEALRTWIPAVIQQVKPYFTPSDIEKGTRWSTDIAGELNDSKIGIICLTKDNLEKPWVMFEAGALSNQLDSSHVCPILFGLDSADMVGPLVQFQATPFTKPEVKKLINTINRQLGEDKLDDSVLNNVFDMWWPRLDEQIKSILERHEAEGEPVESLRDEREVLEEILALTRMSARAVGKKHRDEGMRMSPRALLDLARVYYDLLRMVAAADDLVLIKGQIDSMKRIIDYICRIGLEHLEHSEYSEQRAEILSLLERIEVEYAHNMHEN